ncbi:ROK family protein [Curtobacterium sp. RRHDQ10]|uniref:ROK family protein n=1 Tax=Curtobacterium phyllosphaerae TaxID=3413379 RepID=UPI003BF20AAE
MPRDTAAQPRRRDPGRHQNLGGILRRVHAAPRSRSDLTRATGLNRSTIAALVGELIDRGLVVEDDANGVGAVGRPSPLVRPSDRAVAIAIHPEIDAVRVGAVLPGGRVLRVERVACTEPPSVDDVVQIAVEAVAAIRTTLASDTVVVGAGVAVPGLVRVADGFVRLAPHLGWHEEPLAERLAARLGMPVRAANEATLGAAAEWVFGAGIGVHDLLYVNGGRSGIGGGIVAGGVPLVGAGGHAGEIGHVTVASDDTTDSAGLPGTLEAHVTHQALERAVGLVGVGSAALTRAVVDSDRPEVVALVRQQVRALSTALASVVNVLGTERVVLGGFLAVLLAADGAGLRAEFHRHVLGPLEDVDIRAAVLGDDILLIGAAALPFDRVVEDLPDLDAAEAGRLASASIME